MKLTPSGLETLCDRISRCRERLGLGVVARFVVITYASYGGGQAESDLGDLPTSAWVPRLSWNSPLLLKYLSFRDLLLLFIFAPTFTMPPLLLLAKRDIEGDSDSPSEFSTPAKVGTAIAVGKTFCPALELYLTMFQWLSYSVFQPFVGWNGDEGGELLSQWRTNSRR